MSDFVASEDFGWPRGTVRLIVRDVDGIVVEDRFLGEHNLVVDNFGNQAVYLVGGEFLASAKITKIGLGQGTTELASRTALVDPGGGAVSTATTVLSYTTGPASVTFEGTFGYADGNGDAFTEMGLLFDSATPPLAAIKVFPTMTKSVLFTWTFQWKLDWPY